MRLAALFEFPVRRPGVVVVAAIIVSALAIWAITRLKPDASLEAMLSGDARATRALGRLLNEFVAADELIVMASVPDSSAPTPWTARLEEFARRMEKNIDASPEALQLIESVQWRVDDQAKQFVEIELIPAGLYYLTDAELDAARQRLTAPAMRREIARNEAMMSVPGPAASAMASALARDPLRLHEFLLPRLSAQKVYETLPGTDAMISPDGRAILVRLVGNRSPSDLEFARSITAMAHELAEQANTDQLRLEYTGAYAVASASERSIRRDMIVSVTTSVMGIVILFALVFRRPVRMFLLAFTPVVFGVLIGLAVAALAWEGLTPLTAAIGAVLAGMAIDYSIHYLAHYQALRSDGDRATAASARATRTRAARTSAVLASPLLAAFATSAVGFAAIGSSSVGALRDFSALGTLGLLGAFVACLTVLPAMLSLGGRRPAPRERSSTRLNPAPLLEWIARHGRLCIGAAASILAAAAVVVAAAGWRGELLELETDLSVMHPQPNAPLAAQDHLTERFGVSLGSLVIHLSGETPRDVLTLAHEVSDRLDTLAARETGIAASLGPQTLLPDPRLIESRRAMFSQAEVDRIVADFRAAMADSIFGDEVIAPYAAFLRTLLHPGDAPGLTTLLKYPRLAGTMLTRDAVEGRAEPNEAIMSIVLNRDVADRIARDRVIAFIRRQLTDLPDAALTGISVVGADTERTIHRELPRLILIAGVITIAYLGIHFRSLGHSLLALLPTIYSLVILLATIHLAGVKVNLVNLVAAPLLIGIDVDYGIFLLSLARQARREKWDGLTLARRAGVSCGAILICAATTILGFGSLMTMSVPAVRSLGLAVAVGVVACVVASVFLLLPLLVKLCSNPCPASPDTLDCLAPPESSGD